MIRIFEVPKVHPQIEKLFRYPSMFDVINDNWKISNVTRFFIMTHLI